MTQEYFRKRLILIEENIQKADAQIQQMIANRNLLDGARQEILFYFKEIENESSVPKVVGEFTLEELHEKLQKTTDN